MVKYCHERYLPMFFFNKVYLAAIGKWTIRYFSISSLLFQLHLGTAVQYASVAVKARKAELSTDIKSQAAGTANTISYPYLVASNLIVWFLTFKTENIHHHRMGINFWKNKHKTLKIILWACAGGTSPRHPLLCADVLHPVKKAKTASLKCCDVFLFTLSQLCWVMEEDWMVYSLWSERIVSTLL